MLWQSKGPQKIEYRMNMPQYNKKIMYNNPLFTLKLVVLLVLLP